MEQEKQENSRETKENQVYFVEKQSETMRNKTISIEDARKIIYKWTLEAQNYRDISQIPFQIKGRDGYKKFSIAEISRIKKKFEQNDDSETNTKTESSECKKARIFDLLENNVSPTRIVTITRYQPKLVLETVNEYHNLKDLSPTWFKEFVQIASEWDIKIKSYKEMKAVFKSSVFWYYLMVKEAYYPCAICGKPVYFSPDKNSNWFYDIGDALKELSKHHCHPQCYLD